MAVKFKTKTSANDMILTSLGISPDLIAGLHKAQVEVTSSFTTLTLKAKSGSPELTIQLGTTVNNIVKGTLSPQIKQAVKGTVESNIQKFLLGSAYGASTQTLKQIKPHVPSKSPVQLKDATEMYQAVKGTSAGSVYYVIAMNDTLRVATRILSHRVSIRVEGKLTAEVSNALSKVEISTHDGGYASGHFELTNGVDAGRVIGAVLLGSGLQFTTPLPDVKFLEKQVV